MFQSKSYDMTDIFYFPKNRKHLYRLTNTQCNIILDKEYIIDSLFAISIIATAFNIIATISLLIQDYTPTIYKYGCYSNQFCSFLSCFSGLLSYIVCKNIKYFTRMKIISFITMLYNLGLFSLSVIYTMREFTHKDFFKMEFAIIISNCVYLLFTIIASWSNCIPFDQLI